MSFNGLIYTLPILQILDVRSLVYKLEALGTLGIPETELGTTTSAVVARSQNVGTSSVVCY